METCWKIPTGVISLDATGAILRSNKSVARMFGGRPRSFFHRKYLGGMRSMVQSLMRRYCAWEWSRAKSKQLFRARTASRRDRKLAWPRRANSGFVLVLDDLTEMLRAKVSGVAGSARRIAHEIKNPSPDTTLCATAVTVPRPRETSQTSSRETRS